MAKVPSNSGTPPVSVVFNILLSSASVSLPFMFNLSTLKNMHSASSHCKANSSKLIHSPRCPQHIQPKINYPPQPTQHPRLFSPNGTYPLTELANGAALKVDQMSPCLWHHLWSPPESSSPCRALHAYHPDRWLSSSFAHILHKKNFNGFPHSFNSTKFFII